MKDKIEKLDSFHCIHCESRQMDLEFDSEKEEQFILICSNCGCKYERFNMPGIFEPGRNRLKDFDWYIRNCTVYAVGKPEKEKISIGGHIECK